MNFFYNSRNTLITTSVIHNRNCQISYSSLGITLSLNYQNQMKDKKKSRRWGCEDRGSEVEGQGQEIGGFDDRRVGVCGVAPRRRLGGSAFKGGGGSRGWRSGVARRVGGGGGGGGRVRGLRREAGVRGGGGRWRLGSAGRRRFTSLKIFFFF